MTGDAERNPAYGLIEIGPEPEIRRGHTALLVVDMDYFDAHPDYGIGARAKEKGLESSLAYYFESVQRIIPKIKRLLTASRKAGVEVIYLRVGELTKDSRDAGRRQRVRGLLVPVGSAEARVLDELEPQADELVISKSCSGAFNCTNLDRILRNIGIDTLVIVGVVTHGCVELTARVAADIGYCVLLVGDACASFTEELHSDALERMNDGCTYVKTTQEVLAKLECLQGA